MATAFVFPFKHNGKPLEGLWDVYFEGSSDWPMFEQKRKQEVWGNVRWESGRGDGALDDGGRKNSDSGEEWLGLVMV